MERGSNVRSNTHLHVESNRENGSAIFQFGTFAACQRRHSRVQETQFPSIPSPTQSTFQTWRFLQGTFTSSLWGKPFNCWVAHHSNCTFLFQSGTCTLREAIIVGSVIARCSIPVLHSAAALLKLAEMSYSGANSIFLRILFDKKYALPYRVVDAAVAHFVRYRPFCNTLKIFFSWFFQFQVSHGQQGDAGALASSHANVRSALQIWLE